MSFLTSRAANGLLLMLSAMTLSGCDLLQSPQKVCAASDTVTNIQDMLTDKALTRQNGAVKTDDLKAALDKNWKNGTAKLDLITFSGENKETNIINCSGQVHVQLTPAQRAAYEALAKPDSIEAAVAGRVALSGIEVDRIGDDFSSGEASFNLEFARQPQADGSGYLFSYSRSDKPEIVLIFAALLEVVAEHRAATPTDITKGGTDDQSPQAVPTSPDNTATPLVTPPQQMNAQTPDAEPKQASSSGNENND